MLSTGCVFSDPPVHGEATQTPPVLYPNQAVPSPYGVIEVSAGELFDVTVPLRSEDDGEGLFAELILNHSIQGNSPSQLLDTALINPGSLADLRDVDIGKELPASLTAGCHQITLLVSHQSNHGTRDKSDIATVTWFVNVDDDSDPTNGNLLRDCPKATGAN